VTRADHSNDFLVSEEVLEVRDLKVGREGHHYNWDYTEDDDSRLNLLVLLLEVLLILNKVAEFLSQLLDHILHFLSLNLDRTEMLLGYDVGVVLSLDTSLNHKIEGWINALFIQDADLIVASYVASELISELRVVFLFIEVDGWSIRSLLSWSADGLSGHSLSLASSLIFHLGHSLQSQLYNIKSFSHFSHQHH
jgi:hypothetical protein